MRNPLSTAIGVAAVLTFLAALPIAGEAQTSAIKHQRAVLVTGASTGIGRKITERLAADGYFVYAGARKEENLKARGKIKNVQAVRVDVTNTQEINAAVEAVTKGGREGPACGRRVTCRLRRKAFAGAGLSDRTRCLA